MPGELKGANLFVYSFLDFRQRQLGKEALALFDEGLLAALREAGVPAKLLRYRSTSVSKGYRKPRYGNDWLPVGKVIAENREAEAAAGTRYRLIIFPAELDGGEIATGYAIRWTLSDARTGLSIWDYEYRGAHFLFGGGAEGRAKKFITPAIDSMRAAALF